MSARKSEEGQKIRLRERTGVGPPPVDPRWNGWRCGVRDDAGASDHVKSGKTRAKDYCVFDNNDECF